MPGFFGFLIYINVSGKEDLEWGCFYTDESYKFNCIVLLLLKATYRCISFSDAVFRKWVRTYIHVFIEYLCLYCDHEFAVIYWWPYISLLTTSLICSKVANCSLFFSCVHLIQALKESWGHGVRKDRNFFVSLWNSEKFMNINFIIEILCMRETASYTVEIMCMHVCIKK